MRFAHLNLPRVLYTDVRVETADADDSFVSLEFYVSPETLDSDSAFRNHWGCSS